MTYISLKHCLFSWQTLKTFMVKRPIGQSPYQIEACAPYQTGDSAAELF